MASSNRSFFSVPIFRFNPNTWSHFDFVISMERVFDDDRGEALLICSVSNCGYNRLHKMKIESECLSRICRAKSRFFLFNLVCEIFCFPLYCRPVKGFCKNVFSFVQAKSRSSRPPTKNQSFSVILRSFFFALNLDCTFNSIHLNMSVCFLSSL